MFTRYTVFCIGGKFTLFHSDGLKDALEAAYIIGRKYNATKIVIKKEVSTLFKYNTRVVCELNLT